MGVIKNIIKWVASDGLLHFLVCYFFMVSLFPIIGWWNIPVVILLALIKEGVDYFVEKDNDIKAVMHDLLMDALGIVFAILTLLML